MSEQPNKSVTVMQTKELPAWTAVKLENKLQLSSIKRELLNLPPHVKAEDLSGHTFTIVSLKPFKSSYEQQDHAYFATCMDDSLPFVDEGEYDGVFTTVFGGQMVTEVLDAVVEKQLEGPLEVTLKFVRQGRYSGYYVLE